ncbi:MAG: hypothetical protein ACMG57_02630 [Candidatus Dojkabacteria bacterium]
MQVLKLQLPDFKYKELKEQEDSIRHEGNIFAIADGITRDPIGIPDFSAVSIEEQQKAYPKPSPARISANTFTQSFVYSLGSKEEVSLDNVETAFVTANRKIQELNETNNPKPDYLDHDFWACVATGVVINEHSLLWGAIGDCGVRVYDENWNMKFNTPNSVDVFEKYFFSDTNPYLKTFNWNKPEGRILVRKQFRNNPKQVQNDECVGFGSLTGEPISLNFLYFGNVYISKTDTIVIYSDGFIKTMNTEKFPEVLKTCSKENSLASLEKLDAELANLDYQKHGHERSIMIVNL